MRAALHAHARPPAGWSLMLGNGSDELISLLAMACDVPGASVLAPVPGFVMYGISAALQGIRFVGVPLTADFELDRRAAAATISPREQELLQVLAEGLTNREIATRLVLEESTIRTHLRNIYRKLGVNSRLQAIQRAREIGLL